MRKITIDPITRLEGHGKIVIFLNEKGDVVKAYFQITELRGFEKFLEGRPAEDAPQITSRICGVCSMAHHMAATKALDDLYNVRPPQAAKKIRELVYNAFMLEDHALHVYILGCPDFLVGLDAPKSERNILGVIKKFGVKIGLRVIQARKNLRDLITRIAGRAVHPVFGLPGGISKPLKREDVEKAIEVAEKSLEFALFTYDIFKKVVLGNEEYLKLILSDIYTHKTYYMGLVDEKNRVNFYEGRIRVIDPEGREYAKFDVHSYYDYIAEHVEPWTFVKFPYLRKIGWKGFTDGKDSGILCVGPLARLNVSDSMATPRAQEAYEEMYETIGSKPVHNTLAMHWARIIEMIYAAEKMIELASDPEILDRNVRAFPTETPSVGFGVVEAPRGVLVHHYITDERGVIKKANLFVATQHNAARIALSVDKAAKSLIRGGKVDEKLLNMVEMAFRAYDPCHACATHSFPGSMPLAVYVYDLKGRLVNVFKRF